MEGWGNRPRRKCEQKGGKTRFIKGYIRDDINFSIRCTILKAFFIFRVTQKDGRSGMKEKFFDVIRTNMWIIFAAKYSKMRIERLMMEEGLKWGFGVKYESKQVIYNMYNSNENMIPKIKGKMRLS